MEVMTIIFMYWGGIEMKLRSNGKVKTNGSIVGGDMDKDVSIVL